MDVPVKKTGSVLPPIRDEDAEDAFDEAADLDDERKADSDPDSIVGSDDSNSEVYQNPGEQPADFNCYPDEHKSWVISHADVAAALNGRGLAGLWVNTLMTITTVFALFGSDLQQLYFDKSADSAFEIAFIVCFLLFLIELIVTCIVIDSYTGSFFFWLDIVATVSMLEDVSLLIDPLSAFLLAERPAEFTESSTSYQTGATFAPASQAGTVAARAGRVMRVIRIVRLLRVADFLKLCNFGMGGTHLKSSNISTQEEAGKLGQRLSETNTRRVIVGVFLMLLVLPFLTAEQGDNSQYEGLRHLLYVGTSRCHSENQLLCNSTSPASEIVTDAGWNKMLWLYANRQAVATSDSLRSELVYLELPHLLNSGRLTTIERLQDPAGIWTSLPSCIPWDTEELKKCPFRADELELHSFAAPECTSEQDCDGIYARAVFEIKEKRQYQAQTSSYQTLFLMTLLAAGSTLFSYNTQEMVIVPIANMVLSVKHLADDPLRILDSGEDVSRSNKVDKQDETKALAATIARIGSLLRVGLGTTGAQLVSENMGANEGVINYNMPGKKVLAVFIHIQIPDFGDVTDCLMGEVMTFVNKVAYIVHGSTVFWDGSAVASRAGSFLAVWRYDEALDEVEKNAKGSLSGRSGETVKSNRGLIASSTRGSSNNSSLSLNSKGIQRQSTSNSVNSQSRNRAVRWLKAMGKDSDALFGRQESNAECQASQRTNVIISVMATKALIACLKMVSEVYKTPELQVYSKHPRLVPKFGLLYKVQLYFGLNVGTAIEGMTGTEYKVDAAYISSSINLAVDMQRRAQHYGVALLMSDKFYARLPSKAKAGCRPIDVVYRKENAPARMIYTFDVDEPQATPDGGETPGGPRGRIRVCEAAHRHPAWSTMRFLPQLASYFQGNPEEVVKKPSVHTAAEKPSEQPYEGDKPAAAGASQTAVSRLSVMSHTAKPRGSLAGASLGQLPAISAALNYLIEWDMDIQSLVRERNEEFYRNWNMGFDNYKKGDWTKANDSFQSCLSFFADDGPTKTILHFINARNLKPPVDWRCA